MKNLFLPLLLFFSLAAQAQTSVSNFQVENNSLIYRQVFEQPATEADLMKQLMTIEGISEVKDVDGMLTAKIDGLKVDYKKHGGSWGSTPGVLNFPVFGNLMAEFKDGRYRITISNLKVRLDAQDNDTEFSYYALNRNNEFRTGRNALAILHYTNMHFTDILTLKESSTASEDW